MKNVTAQSAVEGPGEQVSLSDIPAVSRESGKIVKNQLTLFDFEEI